MNNAYLPKIDRLNFLLLILSVPRGTDFSPALAFNHHRFYTGTSSYSFYTSRNVSIPITFKTGPIFEN
jgi:hypothetical protein